MKNFTIRVYESKDYNNWNTFIEKAKNATFLFHRDFMEYHRDRFEDFSLMIFDNEKLVAVLPANRVGNEVFSHQGLTYGGLVYSKSSKLHEINSMFFSVLKMLSEQRIEKLHLKIMPSIYPEEPSDEMEYLMFLLDAKLSRRDALAVLNLETDIKISKKRREAIRRGGKNNLKIREESSFKAFWDEILIPNLQLKHKSQPVHSLGEIEKLKANFPENIKQFNVYHEDKIVAGTTMFITENVAHPQYISGSEQNNELGSLDFLYAYLINEKFAHKKYFDFGPSSFNNGRNIKAGIHFWKESYGASAVSQNFYEITTSKFHQLENVFQ